MKALLCKQYGSPESLVLDDVPTPSISNKQVLISIKACGVNFPDTLIIQGKYQFKPAFPFSPGGELAGIVKALGEEVSHLKIGDSVFAMPGWGGFAEETAVDANRVFRMPAGMDYTVAASFMYTYGTSYHALKNRAQLQAGETLLVLGAAGGVGLAAVNLGKIMGAKVIAAASSDEKLALCKAYGADECINYQTQDLREALKNLPESSGVDVVYDPVGGAFTEPALRSLNWKGRHLVVGFAAGPIPSIALNLALLKGCSIMGVFWGAFVEKEPKANFQNIQELFDFYQRGILKPHIQKTYALSEASQALYDLTQRRAMGKLVIVP